MKKAATIKVDEDQLSLAIGKRGQNARLTAKLTGWEINIEKDESAAIVLENKVTQAAGLLAASSGHRPGHVAQALVKNGFFNVESLLEAEPQDLADILSIDLEQATAIHERAKQEKRGRGYAPAS